jgi:hypothetical protein
MGTLLFVLLSFWAAAMPAQPPVAITHVTVIDCTGSKPKADQTVLIEHDRIAAIGSSIKLPIGTEVIDGKGKFLIPGLWDMHVHWYGEDRLSLFTANGVTGVRIMSGGPLFHTMQKKIDAGKLIGPHMCIGSPIIDGPKPIWPGSMAVGNAEEARAAVDKAAKQGAEFMKPYSLLPRDAYFALAEEAKKLDLPVFGHVPYSVTAEEATNAGQRSIEHMEGIIPGCSSQEQEILKAMSAYVDVMRTGKIPTVDTSALKSNSYDEKKAQVLIADLAKHGTYECPTLIVLRATCDLLDPVLKTDPRLAYMPKWMIAMWDPKKDFRFKNRTEAGNKLAKTQYEFKKSMVGKMHRAGNQFIAGTDVGNPYVYPGFSLHDELALLVEGGLTPMEALQAATNNAAMCMRREKEIGTIEKGKLADMILLDADPLKDIHNTTKIAAVIQGGKVYNRAALDKMLEDAKVKPSESTSPPAGGLLLGIGFGCPDE